MREYLAYWELLAMTVVIQPAMVVAARYCRRSHLLEWLCAVAPLYLAVTWLDKLWFVYLVLALLLLLPRRSSCASHSAPSTNTVALSACSTTDCEPASRTAGPCGSVEPPATTEGNHAELVCSQSDVAKYHSSPTKSSEQPSPPLADPLASARFLIISYVIIAIFAADMPFYESARLGKGMGMGLKLMDIGVGAFVYNAGFFGSRRPPSRKLRTAAIAALFGTVRLATKYLLQLDVDDREFGMHWNFFYGLAVLYILGACWDAAERVCGGGVAAVAVRRFGVGLCCCGLHEWLLHRGLAAALFKKERGGWLDRNLEGAAFVLPQMGMYLLASAMSAAYFAERRRTRLALAFTAVTAVLLATVLPFVHASRHLHNMSFCLANAVLYNTNGTLLYMLVQWLQLPPLPTHSFASRHLLELLLWANVCTCANTHLIQPLLRMDRWECTALHHAVSHALCTGYLYVVLGLPQRLKRRSVK